MYIYIYVYIYIIHIHTYIHACMHAYIHTYIHTYICRCVYIYIGPVSIAMFDYRMVFGWIITWISHEWVIELIPSQYLCCAR